MTQQPATPPPLVPSEVDLRGLEYMPLLGAKLFSSDFNLEASDAEFRAAMQLWWSAWNQTPAASLPNSERAQAKLAGFESEDSSRWQSVKARVLHGFILCDDGRLYHPVLAAQAMIAWERRVEDRAKRDNEADRQRRTRAERTRYFEQLRTVGVTPKWDIQMADLRALVTQHVTPTVTRTGNAQVTAPVTQPVTQPVTVTDTAKTGRDGTIEESAESIPRAPRAQESPQRENPPPEVNGHQPTPAGAICRSMRKAGLQQTNPGDPRFLALIEQGATEAEFVDAAMDAAAKGKGWAWTLAVVVGKRADAAAIVLPPPAPAGRPGEASGKLPVFVPPPALTPEQKAAADEARREVMAKHRRRQA